MQRREWRAAVVLVLFMFAPAAAQVAPPTSAPSTAPTTARVPAPSATQPVIQPRTDARHASFLEIARQGEIDLLFLGDSITDFWRRADRGKAVWDQYFAPLKAANFGISADRTQHLLFRIQNGELEGFTARCIVLLIGTNNLDPNGLRNTPQQTIEGYKLIIEEIRRRQPQAKLLLLAIFPRGREVNGPYRPLIRQVNDFIATQADNKNIFFMDIGDKLLDADGNLPAEVMPDGLHPNENGYRIWATAIIDKVRQLMAMP